jgi:hypothetical protein
MKYKIIVKTKDNTFVKDKSKSKDHLLQKAIAMSKKHPQWKIFVVNEDTIV